MAITYGTASGDAYWELRGLSSDTKPTEGVPNGSTFTEIDTGAEFMFDAAAGNWYLQLANGGGGGTVTAGVASFNGRSGNVLPMAGDYTAVMVGADPAGSAAQALTDANDYTNDALANYTATTEFTQAVDAAVEEALQNSITEADPSDIDALFP